MIPLNKIWAIEPMAARDVARNIAAVAASVAGQVPKAAMPVQRNVVNGVEIVGVKGVLDKDPSWFLDLIGGTSTDVVAAKVNAAAADPEVAGIVLAVDSPGGSVAGLAEAGDTIFKARESKRVVACVSGMCASAAYYLSSQAEAIYAGRMDMIGSIGVRLDLYDYHKYFENLGVEAVPVNSGEFKSAGMMGTEITEEQKAYFQGIVDTFFADFLSAIKRGRSIKGLNEIADGRVFLAAEAKKLGLIDGIKTLDEIISGAAKGRGAPRRAKASLDLLIGAGN